MLHLPWRCIGSVPLYVISGFLSSISNSSDCSKWMNNCLFHHFISVLGCTLVAVISFVESERGIWKGKIWTGQPFNSYCYMVTCFSLLKLDTPKNSVSGEASSTFYDSTILSLHINKSYIKNWTSTIHHCQNSIHTRSKPPQHSSDCQNSVL